MKIKKIWEKYFFRKKYTTIWITSCSRLLVVRFVQSCKRGQKVGVVGGGGSENLQRKDRLGEHCWGFDLRKMVRLAHMHFTFLSAAFEEMSPFTSFVFFFLCHSLVFQAFLCVFNAPHWVGPLFYVDSVGFWADDPSEENISPSSLARFLTLPCLASMTKMADALISACLQRILTRSFMFVAVYLSHSKFAQKDVPFNSLPFIYLFILYFKSYRKTFLFFLLSVYVYVYICNSCTTSSATFFNFWRLLK